MSITEPESVGQRAGRLAEESLRRGDATGWLEELYAQAHADGSGVPWARNAPHPDFLDWLETEAGPGEGRRALAVGCGLGDDAEALAGHGFATTAFDIAPSAIDLCRQRFPASAVEYRAADLFDPPGEWIERFDLVAEIITVQVLPPAMQADALRRIMDLVAPGGLLFVGTQVRQPRVDPSGPPWPLDVTLLDLPTADGFSEIARQTFRLGFWSRVWQERRVYQRSTR